MKFKQFIYYFTIILIFVSLFPYCYVKKQAKVSVKYLQTTFEIDIPGSGYTSTIPLPGGIPDQTYTTPAMNIPDFNLRKQLASAGIDTTDESKMSEMITEFTIDSLAMLIADKDYNKSYANFSYFKKIEMKLNAYNLGSYSTTAPSNVGKYIVFQKGDNLKNVFLSSQTKKIITTITTNGASMPPTTFSSKLIFRVSIVANITLPESNF